VMYAALLLVTALAAPALGSRGRFECSKGPQTFHDFSHSSIYNNETIPFSRYEGKVALVYNAANY